MGAGGATLVLLPILISGYLFNLIFLPLRYFSNQAEGQKLFFMAAGSGLIIAAAIFIITGHISANPAFVGSPVYGVAASIDHSIPIPYACRLVLTVSASVVGAFLLNFVLWLRYKAKGQPTAKRIYNKLTDKFGTPLSQLLRRAAESQKLVLITLKSRKIYCGRILEVPPKIEGENACVELLPSFSTYRDKDTLKMSESRTEYPIIALWEAQQYLYSRRGERRILETELHFVSDTASIKAVQKMIAQLDVEISDAENVLNQFQGRSFKAEDWIKVIPLKEVESASFYDPDSYTSWFAEQQKSLASKKKKNSLRRSNNVTLNLRRKATRKHLKY